MSSVRKNSDKSKDEDSPLRKKTGPSITDTKFSQFGYKPTQLKDRVENIVEKDIIPALQDFVKIPNLSRDFDKDFQTNGLAQKASLHVRDWCRNQGIKGLTIDMYEEEGKTPLVFGMIEPSIGIDNTVLIYGHIDKQPHMDKDWSEGLSATNPVRKGDKIYGRGISDDGYAPFTAISMAKLLQEQDLAHPRFILFFENDEESGSIDIQYWLNRFSVEIGKPELLVCLDATCYDYDHFYVTSSLRGQIAFELGVQVMEAGMHSGAGGGVIPDTNRIARILLNRIEDDLTGKICDGLHVQIPGKVYQDCENVCKILGEKFYANYKLLEGVKLTSENIFENYQNRSQRPSLTITGIDGLPSCANGGNVITPMVTYKVSCRLPPTLDPAKAELVVKELVTKNVPYNAKVHLKFGHNGNGFSAPIQPKHIEDILGEAAREAFDNNQLLFQHSGGSIPFMHLLTQYFPESNFMVTGLLGPQSNAHAGNEMLYVPMLKKLQHGMTRFIQNIANADFKFAEGKKQRLQSSQF